MLRLRLQLHEVDDIDHPDFEVWQVLPQDGNGGKRLECGYVARTTHGDVGLDIVFVTGPLPDADTLRAVFYGGLHREPLGRRVFAGNDHIDVMSASQAVIDRREQAVGIWRQVYANDRSFLVHDMIEESRVLVGEAVVILSPDMGGQ